MKNIAEVLEGVKTVGIGGHIRPDGDCVGSCMALYLYIRKYFPDIDVNVYLDHPKPIFGHIESIDEIKTEVEEERIFDLFITCDVSARDRLALADNLFEHADIHFQKRRHMICLSVWTVGTNSGSDRLHRYFDRLHIRFVSIIM